MDFDFLPKLPKSDLDDRTFKDLVDECILRIPRYCPEWTNYNPSDPGITMIELFAWLTDQMLLRFNQVPRRNYVAFLELLGIQLQPPAAAQTELTFYLSTALPSTYQIPAGIEVATERTEADEAIAFSTDRPLLIAKPNIHHFLTAETAETVPTVLRDRFTHLWNQQDDGHWEGRELPIFSEQPQPGNCFYIGFDTTQPIEGNVVALTVGGEAATSTGINPDHPPLRWEAWDGEGWRSVLLNDVDDGTRGFSFNGHESANAMQAADVLLHLPLIFPAAYFGTYQGRWIRCVYVQPQNSQSGYSGSPQIMKLAVRSVGGTIEASQCKVIRDELIGQSDGNPGQSFQIRGIPILPRQNGEHLLVIPPNGVPQIWQEVSDFADSGADDRHYLINSQTGVLQFGPLIREPAQLKDQTRIRSRVQWGGESLTQVLEATADDDTVMERQYGAVPPRGSSLRMVAYRTGGGQKGNVQRHTLRTLKSAVPYVARATNHIPARNGADAESLDDAVIRVPRMLRTRDRAVTPEDFETLTLQAGRGAVARVLCPTQTTEENRGRINLLVVPHANTESINRGEGIDPIQFALTPPLKERVLSYLDERRLLGVEVRLLEPEYVGVAVQTEVGLEPEYNHPQAQQEILRSLRVQLYRFLNPLTGGVKGEGWSFGSPVYPSDIITLMQKTPGVRYLGAVLLFELRRQGDSWVRSLTTEGIVNPGPQGLICSWADSQLRSGHAISLIT
ncbi:MAG: putative baseplate assembly protein [Oculatellaceae cyanobacterium Prado106]|jgi:predicted phage baseplate assembly protein|nr:putative baseplate assembly protein [Oculatellaceae cyanobacterium Prado106]